MKNTRMAARKQQDVGLRQAKNGRAKSDLSGNDATTAPVFVAKKVVDRKISSLRPNPKQEHFPDLSDDELQRLAESMKRGLDNPIEILPNGTIICGHQRVKAATLLGWPKIRCWVRYDLAEQGEAAVERRLIEDNFNRRQLGPIEKATCFRRLMELERSKPCRNGELKGDLRDYYAKQFGCSGRNLERWVKLLDTPPEIQRAVVEKKLKLVDGADLATLPQETQEQIARAIRKGTDPKQAVAKHCSQTPTPPTPDTLYRHFRCNLETTISELGPNLRDVDLRYRRSDLPLLRNGKKFLEKVEARIEKVAKPESPELDEEVEALLAAGKSKRMRDRE